MHENNKNLLRICTMYKQLWR